MMQKYADVHPRYVTTNHSHMSHIMPILGMIHGERSSQDMSCRVAVCPCNEQSIASKTWSTYQCALGRVMHPASSEHPHWKGGRDTAGMYNIMQKTTVQYFIIVGRLMHHTMKPPTAINPTNSATRTVVHMTRQSGNQQNRKKRYANMRMTTTSMALDPSIIHDSDVSAIHNDVSAPRRGTAKSSVSSCSESESLCNSEFGALVTIVSEMVLSRISVSKNWFHKK
mmetsp:Transcript_15003/g.41305  ORF Transcript_15003/g.41305 Transcript_15003/m.41305 type:complete len:225 (+) Transcript_15003:2612-3286(+)